MFCTHCGKPLKDGDKVCKNCGEKVRSGKISNMIPDDVVDKTKDALNKAKDLGNKMVDQVPDSVKNKTLEVEKKVSSKLPDNLKKNKKQTYTIFGVVVLVVFIFVIWLFTHGYSDDIEYVRNLQNVIMESNNVTFGEVMDYALKGEKWRDVTYEGKNAVKLTGTYVDDGKEMEAIIYVEDDSDIAYYRVEDSELDGLYLMAHASEYAGDAAEYYGR